MQGPSETAGFIQAGKRQESTCAEPDRQRGRKMDKSEAIKYGKTVIEMHEEDKDSLTYQFAKLALDELQKDAVSRETYDQAVQERDIAIRQLKELGYELGEKIEPQTARWIVKIDHQGWYRVCSNCGNRPLKNQWGTGDALSSHCPSCGKEMVIIENPEE